MALRKEGGNLREGRGSQHIPGDRNAVVTKDGGGRREGILTFGRMLETAVCDGSQQLRLQEKVSETSGVNTDIGTLFVSFFTLHCCVCTFSLLLVVDFF